MKNYSGTLQDLASQVPVNVILQHKGAKLVSSVPFDPCPGEAGLDRFSLPSASGHGKDILEVAFTNWNGNATIASYQRFATTAENPAALSAMRHAVCST